MSGVRAILKFIAAHVYLHAIKKRLYTKLIFALHVVFIRIYNLMPATDPNLQVFPS